MLFNYSYVNLIRIGGEKINSKILLLIAAVVVIFGGFVLLKSVKKVNNVNSLPVQKKQAVQALPTPQAKQMEANVVEVKNSGFNPQTITVKVGAKVTWMNKSGDVVAVNSAVHPTHLVYPPLNLGKFNDGESVSLVFDTKGMFKYHNHLNPSETGAVVVE